VSPGPGAPWLFSSLRHYRIGSSRHPGGGHHVGDRGRLTVPADAPVTQLVVNADGSTDIHFGPTAPARSSSNWVPTDAAGQFGALFRFHGPTPALYDHTWQEPDMERTTAAT
jgi:Protein of unknown function (DUF1214)